tara:strand:- start:31 stop:219 length:189 start_codon:yes stop_codon:yes gene_type:complete
VVVAGNSKIRNIMRILLFLFIGLLSLNVSYADVYLSSEVDIKPNTTVFNEDSSEAEEEPDCE